jgi:hypothetical protein
MGGFLSAHCLPLACSAAKGTASPMALNTASPKIVRAQPRLAVLPCISARFTVLVAALPRSSSEETR